MSEARRDRKGTPSNKRPHHNNNTNKGLSERSLSRLNGFSQALESPNSPPIFFSSRNTGKLSHYDRARIVLDRLSNLKIQLRNAIRERRAAEALRLHEAN
jgi:hypothetical protein